MIFEDSMNSIMQYIKEDKTFDFKTLVFTISQCEDVKEIVVETKGYFWSRNDKIRTYCIDIVLHRTSQRNYAYVVWFVFTSEDDIFVYHIEKGTDHRDELLRTGIDYVDKFNTSKKILSKRKITMADEEELKSLNDNIKVREWW